MNTCNYKIDIRGREIFESEPTVVVFLYDTYNFLDIFSDKTLLLSYWKRADRGEIFIKGRIYHSDLIKVMVGRE